MVSLFSTRSIFTVGFCSRGSHTKHSHSVVVDAFFSFRTRRCCSDSHKRTLGKSPITGFLSTPRHFRPAVQTTRQMTRTTQHATVPQSVRVVNASPTNTEFAKHTLRTYQGVWLSQCDVEVGLITLAMTWSSTHPVHHPHDTSRIVQTSRCIASTVPVNVPQNTPVVSVLAADTESEIDNSRFKYHTTNTHEVCFCARSVCLLIFPAPPATPPVGCLRLSTCHFVCNTLQSILEKRHISERHLFRTRSPQHHPRVFSSGEECRV